MTARWPTLFLFAGLAAALFYWLMPHWPDALGAAFIKGSAVALFALYASARVADRDGWALVAVMAFGALGDVLIEWRLEAGAAAFIIGHIIATQLYWRNRRRDAPHWPWLLVPACIYLSAWLSSSNSASLYALFVSAMAASALTSRFPPMLTGLGALLFLTSDLFIFARLGGHVPLALAHWVIWPLYVIGQALICFGVVSTLARTNPSMAQQS